MNSADQQVIQKSLLFDSDYVSRYSKNFYLFNDSWFQAYSNYVLSCRHNGSHGWQSGWLEPEPPLTKGSPLCGLFTLGKQKSTLIQHTPHALGLFKLFHRKNYVNVRWCFKTTQQEKSGFDFLDHPGIHLIKMQLWLPEERTFLSWDRKAAGKVKSCLLWG